MPKFLLFLFMLLNMRILSGPGKENVNIIFDALRTFVTLRRESESKHYHQTKSYFTFSLSFWAVLLLSIFLLKTTARACRAKWIRIWRCAHSIIYSKLAIFIRDLLEQTEKIFKGFL